MAKNLPKKRFPLPAWSDSLLEVVCCCLPEQQGFWNQVKLREISVYFFPFFILRLCPSFLLTLMYWLRVINISSVLFCFVLNRHELVFLLLTHTTLLESLDCDWTGSQSAAANQTLTGTHTSSWDWCFLQTFFFLLDIKSYMTVYLKNKLVGLYWV